jgi:succinyl-CoA synthetase beta subunit
LDREKACPVIKYSKHGNMSYTQILKNHPDEIKCIYVDIIKGLSIHQLVDVAVDLQIEQQKSQLTFILKHLYDLFIERDVETLQLCPLVFTNDNRFCVSHAKIKIDRDSTYRQ